MKQEIEKNTNLPKLLLARTLITNEYLNQKVQIENITFLVTEKHLNKFAQQALIIEKNSEHK